MKQVRLIPFEKVMNKVTSFVFKFGIVFFIFIVIRFIAPDFVQYLIDQLYVAAIFLVIIAYLLTGNSKPDRTEMSSRVRHEQTSELERMIESEKETIIF